MKDLSQTHSFEHPALIMNTFGLQAKERNAAKNKTKTNLPLSPKNKRRYIATYAIELTSRFNIWTVCGYYII